MTDMLKFEHPKNQSNIIKVIGVGGGGNNAVTHMALEGIKGVDFIICNTDAQALDKSPVPNKVHLGKRNLGAGNMPSVGRDAALETVDEIKDLLSPHTKMLFITAGMGGGTGTGAAPIVAKIARELDILTVGIVTIPFSFEGKKRRQQALEGIEDLRQYVDTLLIISNDKLREEYGDMRITQAFKKADDVLATAARGIAEIITVTGYINVDFEDVKTVMKNSGKAIMGSSRAEGENRALKAIEEAMRSPLLNDSNISGAKNILLYITSGKEEISLDEVHEITDYIQQTCGNTAEVIWGNGIDDTLSANIGITIIATGFETDDDMPVGSITRAVKKVNPLYDDQHVTPKPEPKQSIVEEKPFVQEVKPRLESLRFHDEEITINDHKPEPKQSGHKPSVVHQLFNDEDEQPKSMEPAEEKAEITSRTYNPKTEGKQETKETVIFSFETQELPNLQPEIKQFRPSVLPDTEKEEMEKKSVERQNRLKDMSMKLKSKEDLNQLETQPAYMRRGMNLNTMGSDNTEQSRYSLDGRDDKPGLRSDNSFLHDNVD
jgi:cell division protein FtsZ